MHLRQDSLSLKDWLPILFLLSHLWVRGGDLQISSVEATGDTLKVQYPSVPSSYYVLYEGSIDDISNPKRLQLGLFGTNQFTTPIATEPAGMRFYRLREVDRNEPLDIDGDGIDDVYELERETSLNPLDPSDAEMDSDRDGRDNRDEYENFDDPELPSGPGLGVAPAKSVFLLVPLVTGGLTKDAFGRTLENITGPPSINDGGTVAFIGEVKYPDGSLRQNIYTLRNGEPTPLPLMTNGFEWPKTASLPNDPFEPWQTFQGPIINNSGTVLSVRHLQTRATLVDFGQNVFQQYPLLSYVEKWDGTTTSAKTHELVDSGDPVKIGAMYWFNSLGILTFKQPHYAGEKPSVLPFSSAWGDGIRTRAFGFNNSGQSAYITRHNSQPYLASSLAKEPSTARAIPSTARYPDIADDGTIVMNFENRVTLFSADLANLKSLSEAGFSSIGEFPAISDDGRIVAFSGISAGDAHGITPGPGIFAAIKRGTANATVTGWEIARVVGVSGNGYLDPGELATRGTPIDQGLIGGFDLTGNVGIGNDGVITYVARDLQGNKCLFSSRLNINRSNFQNCDGDIQMEIQSPQKIAAAGAAIPGTTITVSDLGLFDPIDNHSAPSVAFWVRDTSGTTHILRSTELLRIRSEDRLVGAAIDYETIQRLYPNARVEIKFKRADDSDEAYGPYFLRAPNSEQPGAYAYDNSEQLLTDEDPHLRDTSQQIVVLRGSTPGALESFALFDKPGEIKVRIEITNPTTQVLIEESHVLVHNPQVSALLNSFDSHLGTLNVSTGLQPPVDSFVHRTLVAKIGAALFDSLRAKAATYLGNVDGFWEGLKGDAESIGSIAEGVQAVVKDPYGSAQAIVELCRQFQPECIDFHSIISKLGREIQEGVDNRLEWARLQGGQIVHDAYIEGFMAGYFTEQWVVGALTAGVGKGVLKAVELAKGAKALVPVFGAMSEVRRGINSINWEISQFVPRTKLAPVMRLVRDELGVLSLGGLKPVAARLIEVAPTLRKFPDETLNQAADILTKYDARLIGYSKARIIFIAEQVGSLLTTDGLIGLARLSGALEVRGADELIQQFVKYTGGAGDDIARKEINNLLEMFSDKQGLQFKFTQLDQKTWRSPAGIIYGYQSTGLEGHGLLHALSHAVANPGKPLHSVYNVAPSAVFDLLDKAWVKRFIVQPNPQGANRVLFEIPMTPMVVGTDLEQHIAIVVEGVETFVTGFPFKR